MTRLKTIFLAVCACTFVSTSMLSAQSSSCASKMNMSVNADCTFTLGLENIQATGPAASGQSFKFEGIPTVFTLTSGNFTSSLQEIGIPDGGTKQYTVFANADGTGPMLCWGEINFEIKNTPEPIITVWPVMCGQPLPNLLTAEDLSATIGQLCAAPITDLVESREVLGESCDGFRTIRKITGIVNYASGQKATIPLVIDTIIEMPLNVDDIVCPIGGPNKLDGIILACDDLDGQYPTPSVVERLAPEGLRAAYPYIPKGLDTSIVFGPQVVTLQDTTIEMVKVIDDHGTEYWIQTEVINKRDTVMMIPDTTITDVVIALKEGATCNLSAKYSDQGYPGCAGPESKILREWQILDWCNGSIKECLQWIIIETEGPMIEPIADKTVAISPWTCDASLALSANVDRGCSETLEVIFQTSIGIIDDNNVLSGLWLGESAEVSVTAIDDCGQRVTETFLVTPVDSIAPVAVAADQVNLSLSGDPLVTSDQDRGIGKVYVDAIDAGSHNTGCGEVSKCILLKEELENPVIIGGEHIEVDGQPIYHAAGCEYDGVLPGRPATKTEPAVAEIYYVYCKEYVKFCCASLGENQVSMLVSNGSDRTAKTWTTVLVEDKSFAIVNCPEPITVGCDEEYEIPRPVVYESICSSEPLEMSMTENFDNCGNGEKTITWTRAGEVVCVSSIFIDGESGFNPYEIKWPKHYDGTNVAGLRRECEDGVIVQYSDDVSMGDPFECVSGGLTGEPVWCQSSCGLIGVNYEDQALEGVEACSKIIRRWTIIDWCTYEANDGQVDDENDSFDQFVAIDDQWLGEGDWLTDGRSTEGQACRECDNVAGQADDVYFRYDTVDVDGYYTFDQILKIQDYDDPIITAVDTVIISITGGATAKGEDFDDCVGSGEVTATAEDFCGVDRISTRTASWFVQVFRLDDGREELLNTTNERGNEVTVSTMTGQSGDVHKVRWIVRDGCGNDAVHETYVIYVEDKKPTPLCTQTLSTSTMSTDGTATIWATDFDAGSFDNCSEVDLFFKDADGNYASSLVFTCADIEDGISQTFNMELYAVDQLGNFDFCNVSLRVDDFSNSCEDTDGAVDGSTAQVSGAIATYFGDKVEDVQVQLDADTYSMTNIDGLYAFANLTDGYAEIKPAKNDDYGNGISSIDLVQIQRHITGVKPLDNPYLIIAADINNDSRVSALDLIDLRKFLLGQTQTFTRNSSWRFVDATQEFANPASPFPFVESIRIDDTDQRYTSQNFMAVKIGDVNGSVLANSAAQASTRSNEMLHFTFSDVQAQKGDIIEVSVQSDNFDDIIAYQYTMDINGLELQSVESEAIKVSMENFAVLDQETITTSWYSVSGITTEQPLYTMTFIATADINVTEAIGISSRVTDALAYNDAQEKLGVMTMAPLSSIGVEQGFALEQNKPNPFSDMTEIVFQLPEAGQATLTVMDLTGRVLLTQTDTYRAGTNKVALSTNQLAGSGVMYYQLESGEHIATKKMILIGSR